MPLEYYDCPDHGNSIEVPQGQRPPKSITCHWCPRRAKHVGRISLGIDVSLKEIPPHYNPSLGCRVEGRKHLEQLQAIHGCHDYSPGPGATPPSDWDRTP